MVLLNTFVVNFANFASIIVLSFAVIYGIGMFYFFFNIFFIFCLVVTLYFICYDNLFLIYATPKEIFNMLIAELKRFRSNLLVEFFYRLFQYFLPFDSHTDEINRKLDDFNIDGRFTDFVKYLTFFCFSEST